MKMVNFLPIQVYMHFKLLPFLIKCETYAIVGHHNLVYYFNFLHFVLAIWWTHKLLRSGHYHHLIIGS